MCWVCVNLRRLCLVGDCIVILYIDMGPATNLIEFRISYLLNHRVLFLMMRRTTLLVSVWEEDVNLLPLCRMVERIVVVWFPVVVRVMMIVGCLCK